MEAHVIGRPPRGCGCQLTCGWRLATLWNILPTYLCAVGADFRDAALREYSGVETI